MADNDIKTICEKIESLHAKILKSKFAETVTESEMLSLILAVKEINRQKAEIERLQIVKKHIQNLILRDCDYSDTESYNNAFKKALERLYDNGNIKSEAVKEFAEKVKMAFYYEFDELIPSIMADKIDNLVKEMVGAE